MAAKPNAPAGSEKPRASRVPAAIQLAAAPLLFLLLAAPCFRFPFLSDDFAFLNRALSFRFKDLLPDPNSAFYRPISRELYFGFLGLFGGAGPMVAHVLNAALLVGVILLISAVGRRLFGPAAALFAGLFFAAAAPLPLMVGWASCSQDILAILFLLAALHAQLRGRGALALLFAAGALLSKESALFLFPALAGIGFLLGGSREDLRRHSLRYLVLAAAWALLNPKIRGLLAHGPATGPGGYVGLDNPRAVESSVAMASTLLNFPPTGVYTPWPTELDGIAIAAFASVLALLIAGGAALAPRAQSRLSWRKVALIGLLSSVVPGILTALWTKHWSPYYASMPAIGCALVLAAIAVRLGPRPAAILLLVFLVLGIWYRGMESEAQGVPTERNWRALASRLDRVESGLLSLRPRVPTGAQLYLDIQAPVATQLHSQLLVLQAPAIWYRDPTVRAMDIEKFREGRAAAFLFYVTPDCDVSEIELPSLRARSARGAPAEGDYEKALRRFALGLYASGDVDRAVSVLLGIHATEGMTRDFDHRMAATLLFAAGRTAEASRLRDATAALDRAMSLAMLGGVIGAGTGSDRLDIAAFQAFGVSPLDPEAYRYLMEFFSNREQLQLARRMAEHLLVVRPGDVEATQMRAAVLAVPSWEQPITLPKRTTSR